MGTVAKLNLFGSFGVDLVCRVNRRGSCSLLWEIVGIQSGLCQVSCSSKGSARSAGLEVVEIHAWAIHESGLGFRGRVIEFHFTAWHVMQHGNVGQTDKLPFGAVRVALLPSWFITSDSCGCALSQSKLQRLQSRCHGSNLQ